MALPGHCAHLFSSLKSGVIVRRHTFFYRKGSVAEISQMNTRQPSSLWNENLN